MAATPVKIGNSNADGSETSTSTTITVGASVVPPDAASVLMAWRGGEGGSAHAASDDSGGAHAWTIEAQLAAAAGFNLEALLFGAHNVDSFASADELATSWTTDVFARTAFAVYVSGLAPTDTFVDSAVAEINDDTTHDSTSITLTAGTYFLLGVYLHGISAPNAGNINAPSGDWANLELVADECRIDWREVTITENTAFSYVPTTDNPTDSASIIAAYKAKPSMVILRRRMEGY